MSHNAKSIIIESAYLLDSFFGFFCHHDLLLQRCFPTKAIAVWTATGDADHIFIVGSYFHYSGFENPPKAEDISPKPGIFGSGDPMYVVHSSKSKV